MEKSVGALTFTQKDDGKWYSSLPSGKPVVISQSTLEKFNDPEYISNKRAELIEKFPDSADRAALNSFYDSAPSQIPNLKDTPKETPPPEPPKPETKETNTNKADDDTAPPATTASATTTGSDTSSAPPATTIAGSAGSSPNSKADTNVVGQRDYNPLSEFSSYTYKIALYMLSPSEFNAYMAGDYSRVKDFKLLVQSGGINQAQDSQRAPGFDLDFYIDDLEIVTKINSKETLAATNSIDFRFKIYEPFGFSFPNKLTNAQVQAQKDRAIASNEKNPLINSLTENLLLSIKFYGYDKNGKLVTGKDYPQADVNKSDEQAVFERGFCIRIKDFKFKLENKVTVYSISAVQISEQIAKGTKLGTVPSKITLSGETVKDVLVGSNQDSSKKNIIGLAQVLNDTEQKLLKADKPNITTKNEYVIEFDTKTIIPDSRLVAKDYYVKERTPMSNILGSMGSNERTAWVNRLGAVDKAVRTIEIAGGTPIVQAIDQIITQSEFVKNMVIAIDKEIDQPAKDTDPTTDSNSNPATFDWFNISTKAEIIGTQKDPKRNDYAYKITYRINKYQIPYIRALYVSKTSQYYGPHKRYKYWYTGENTEILSYEQDFNLLFNVEGALASDAATKNLQSAATTLKTNQKVDSLNSKPGTNDIVNSVKSFLYSPGDLIKFKMSILGDPDYIMPSVGLNGNNGLNLWYGDNLTINPNSGQVFIEIYFEQAEDYDNSTGTIPHDGKIQFMNYPSSMAKKPVGMVYMLTDVVSTFSKGRFEQTLKGVIPEFAIAGDSSEGRSAPPASGRG